MTVLAERTPPMIEACPSGKFADVSSRDARFTGAVAGGSTSGAARRF
jgi:hypothetical protein